MKVAGNRINLAYFSIQSIASVAVDWHRNNKLFLLPFVNFPSTCGKIREVEELDGPAVSALNVQSWKLTHGVPTTY
jgi:hypothetical protein